MNTSEQRTAAVAPELGAAQTVGSIGGGRRPWTAPQVIVSVLSDVTDKPFNTSEFTEGTVFGPS